MPALFLIHRIRPAQVGRLGAAAAAGEHRPARIADFPDCHHDGSRAARSAAPRWRRPDPQLSGNFETAYAGRFLENMFKNKWLFSNFADAAGWRVGKLYEIVPIFCSELIKNVYGTAT